MKKHSLTPAYKLRSNVINRNKSQQPKPIIKLDTPSVKKVSPPKLNPIIQKKIQKNPPILVKDRKNIIKLGPKPPKINKDNNLLSLKGIGKERILIIVANGPSFKEIDIDKLQSLIKESKMIDTLSINNPYNGLWPTNYWMFADTSQYDAYRKEFETYNGIIINTTAITKKKKNQLVVRYKGSKGFSKNLEEGFFLGRSTTYASMQVAFYMNYEKVFILGLDMTSVNGEMHYYGQNKYVKNDIRQKRFEIEASYYQHAATVLTPEERNRFYVCSQYNPYDFVKSFNVIPTNKAIEEISKSTPKVYR